MRRFLSKRVLRGIRLCMRFFHSPGSRPVFTALLFGRRGHFFTALINILWEVQYFWLDRFFKELFAISSGVNVRL